MDEEEELYREMDEEDPYYMGDRDEEEEYIEDEEEEEGEGYDESEEEDEYLEEVEDYAEEALDNSEEQSQESPKDTLKGHLHDEHRNMTYIPMMHAPLNHAGKSYSPGCLLFLLILLIWIIVKSCS